MIEFIDGTDVRGMPTNSDEALAKFIAYAQPGDRITVHQRLCRTHSDCDARCTCEPDIIRIGPKG